MNCESCDIELIAVPLWQADRYYCCSGCAAGGPCRCSYVDDPGRLGNELGIVPLRVRDLLDRYDSEIQREGSDKAEYLEIEDA